MLTDQIYVEGKGSTIPVILMFIKLVLLHVLTAVTLSKVSLERIIIKLKLGLMLFKVEKRCFAASLVCL